MKGVSNVETDRHKLWLDMRKRRLTQTEIAKQCGCAQSKISSFLNYDSDMAPELLQRIKEYVYSKPEYENGKRRVIKVK